jgi:hypothetical protein
MNQVANYLSKTEQQLAVVEYLYQDAEFIGEYLNLKKKLEKLKLEVEIKHLEKELKDFE